MRSRLILASGTLIALALSFPDAVRAQEAEPDKSGLERAIARGVEYLVTSQKKDGSWGSPATNLHDIYAPPPGSQRTFQVASSALALSALLEVGGDDPAVLAAIGRGKEFLIARHGVRRIMPDTLYNVWASGYALEAFARLLAIEKDPEEAARLRKAAREAIELLDRFQFVEGGWGYYNFDVQSKDPGPGSTCFTTATILIALKMISDQGVEVPKHLVRGGLNVLKLSERPDNAFAYSVPHRFNPSGGVNQVKGSLARTPACLLAMDDWRPEVDRDRMRKALNDLETHGRFLLIARKYPIPHEAWYQNSGYFCFYGYYYAAIMLHRLPEKERAVFQKQITNRLVGLQEQDGSFWDYQLFNYHKAYGTGYVLMALGRCRAGS
ncbi:MAG: hypothetical protein V2A76_17750 [Planctomycetota bacterium]